MKRLTILAIVVGIVALAAAAVALRLLRRSPAGPHAAPSSAGQVALAPPVPLAPLAAASPPAPPPPPPPVLGGWDDGARFVLCGGQLRKAPREDAPVVAPMPECILLPNGDFGGGDERPEVKATHPRPRREGEWLKLEHGWVAAREVRTPTVLTYRGKRYFISLVVAWVDHVEGDKVVLRGHEDFSYLPCDCEDCSKATCGCSDCDVGGDHGDARGEGEAAGEEAMTPEAAKLAELRTHFPKGVPLDLQGRVAAWVAETRSVEEARAVLTAAQAALETAQESFGRAQARATRAEEDLTSYVTWPTRTVTLPLGKGEAIDESALVIDAPNYECVCGMCCT